MENTNNRVLFPVLVTQYNKLLSELYINKINKVYRCPIYENCRIHEREMASFIHSFIHLSLIYTIKKMHHCFHRRNRSQ
jgi:hypothetical protein